jgi:hypothetical protein
MIYKTTVDTQSFKLLTLANKSDLTKTIKLDGHDFTAEFMLHRALKGGEFERQKFTKK